jgi:hypothetical protein
VESWYQGFREGGKELWSLPACTPRNVEFTLGGNRIRQSDGNVSGNLLAQAKWLLKPLEEKTWGTGFAAGVLARGSRPPGEQNLLSSLYAYNVTSAATTGERFVLLTLLGLRHDTDERATSVIWGVGSETVLFSAERQQLILAAETSGTDTNRFYQAGFRFWLVRNRVQIDAVAGGSIAAEAEPQRWVSLGIRLISGRFLP